MRLKVVIKMFLIITRILLVLIILQLSFQPINYSNAMYSSEVNNNKASLALESYFSTKTEEKDYKQVQQTLENLMELYKRRKIRRQDIDNIVEYLRKRTDKEIYLRWSDNRPMFEYKAKESESSVRHFFKGVLGTKTHSKVDRLNFILTPKNYSSTEKVYKNKLSPFFKYIKRNVSYGYNVFSEFPKNTQQFLYAIDIDNRFIDIMGKIYYESELNKQRSGFYGYDGINESDISFMYEKYDRIDRQKQPMVVIGFRYSSPDKDIIYRYEYNFCRRLFFNDLPLLIDKFGLEFTVNHWEDLLSAMEDSNGNIDFYPLIKDFKFNNIEEKELVWKTFINIIKIAKPIDKAYVFDYILELRANNPMTNIEFIELVDFFKDLLKSNYIYNNKSGDFFVFNIRDLSIANLMELKKLAKKSDNYEKFLAAFLMFGAKYSFVFVNQYWKTIKEIVDKAGENIYFLIREILPSFKNLIKSEDNLKHISFVFLELAEKYPKDFEFVYKKVFKPNNHFFIRIKNHKICKISDF